jgi:acyl-coenzyme A thioesterase PaaI-like protein
MFGPQPTSEELMSAILAQARHVLASQPFSVLLGAEILDCSLGRVELRVPIRPELLQQHGFVHLGEPEELSVKIR